MTDVLRIAHPQDCPLEGNPEVGNPEGNPHAVGNKKYTIAIGDGESYMVWVACLLKSVISAMWRTVKNQGHTAHPKKLMLLKRMMNKI